MQTAAEAAKTERACTDSSKSAWVDELPACFLYSAIRSLQAVMALIRLQQGPGDGLWHTAQLRMCTWVPT